VSIWKRFESIAKQGRSGIESVTIDRKTAWLTVLGRTVEIRIRPCDRRTKAAELVIAET
jgi:hypothetical protein